MTLQFHAYNGILRVGQRPSVGLDDGMCEIFKMVMNCVFQNLFVTTPVTVL
jgi:hypothetical protein